MTRVLYGFDANGNPEARQATDAEEANIVALTGKAGTALTNNATFLALPDPTSANTAYLGHAAIPAGTLTLVQLSGIIRTLSDQVDALTRQNDALVAQDIALTRQMNVMIRLWLAQVSTITDT